jgi:NitT/TauT family transport system substrate-binding protein
VAHSGAVRRLLRRAREGIALVNVAQVFAHSGMREIAFKSSGIHGAADLRGRKVAVWFAGNEFELLATLQKYGIDRRRDVTLVPQPSDMRLLLDKKVDAAAAMTYNEYYQVLDAGVKPDDLIVIDFNAEGTAMLEDGIFAANEWLGEPKNKNIAARFVRASFEAGNSAASPPGSASMSCCTRLRRFIASIRPECSRKSRS